MFGMIENEQMGKGIEEFENEIKEGDTKGIVYKQDSSMEGLIRKEFLIEKYGEDKFNEILRSQNLSISDLAEQKNFIEFCKIADSNI